MSDKRTTDGDAELMRRIQLGETELFAQLVGRYQRALVRVARSRLGRDDWAEEAVQETFLAAFKARRTYDSRFSFRTWLWTILINQCRSHFARRQRAPQLESWPDEATGQVDAALHDAVPPLSSLLARERTERLESLLGRLSVVQADALRLRFFAGLKFQEIAATMDCSLGTAKNRVRGGLLRMSEMMQGRSLDQTIEPRASIEPTSNDSLAAREEHES